MVTWQRKLSLLGCIQWCPSTNGRFFNSVEWGGSYFRWFTLSLQSCASPDKLFITSSKGTDGDHDGATWEGGINMQMSPSFPPCSTQKFYTGLKRFLSTETYNLVCFGAPTYDMVFKDLQKGSFTKHNILIANIVSSRCFQTPTPIITDHWLCWLEMLGFGPQQLLVAPMLATQHKKVIAGIQTALQKHEVLWLKGVVR